MKTLIAVGLVIYSSFGFAAKEITTLDHLPSNAVLLGTVSYSRPTASPTEIVDALSAKADKLGGKYFKVISMEVAGKSRGEAIVYN
ncbi:DUF1471 domain-containing protein [Serratia fonticola]|uniref:DUF1471 domain-containing protein n=1 Tax=Serratia fonticola TaxID=47917 RepID=UPI000E0F989F|nr:DUF1471 domain-containing protein [Serratia fonticola]RDL15159.1 uncharacterized protein DUF1471 [Serratia fonticola]